jgi:hypothetical protein
MDDKRLRRRCEARVQKLDLSAPFEVYSFCERLSAQRDRPILLQSVPGTANACGVWVSVPSADLIFYEQDTSPMHQDHIILHEISHLLCEHQPVPVSAREISHLLFPDLHPETVKRVLQRSGYATEEEREAELLASLILERVATGTHARASTAKRDDVLGRLEASLQAAKREPS